VTPELNKKLTGMSVCTSTSDLAVVDLKCELESGLNSEATLKEICAVMKAQSEGAI